MRILSLTAGAASMYCGSCLRDNALARELLRQGHEVALVPIYTPTLTDEENVSEDEVLFGGISVYLQQASAVFRHTPSFVDKLWDSMPALRLASKRSIATDPRLLGELTISMLEGERGVLRKEFVKLRNWIRANETPDIVNLPNALLLALARPLKEEFGCPVSCTMQGEDLFLDGLASPYRQRALELIGEQTRWVDGFIAISRFYAGHMAQFLGLPEDAIEVAPLGIDPTDFESAPARRRGGGTVRIGYLARIAPEKGLHLLCEAYSILRGDLGIEGVQLEAAGYLGPEHRKYLEENVRHLKKAGLGAEFTYWGEVDREAKIRYLENLDIFVAPAAYDEPKGLPLLEAWASGLPVIAPERGSFPEMIGRTGGGLMVEPDSPRALAEAMARLVRDRDLAQRLGSAGEAGLRRHYHVSNMAEAALRAYAAIIDRAGKPAAAHNPVAV